MNWLNGMFSSSADNKTSISFIPISDADDKKVLKKGEHYLRVRVKALRLGVDRRLWASYSPLLIFEIKGIFSEGLQSLVRVVGRESGTDAGKITVPVDVRDVVLLGYAPYSGDDIETTIQLYSMKSGDLARRMFDSLDRITGTIMPDMLGPYLSVAQLVTNEISNLLQWEELKEVVSVRQGFPRNNIHPGILIYANAPIVDVKRYLKRYDEQDIGTFVRMAFIDNKPTWDYCVIELESHDSREDISTLDFHTKWERDVLPLVWEGDVERARGQLVSLFRDIRMAQQLTEKDRKAMPITYRVEFEKEVEAWLSLNSGKAGEKIYRNGVSTMDIPPSAGNAMYDVALKSGVAIEPFLKLKERIHDYPVDVRNADSCARPKIGEKLAFMKSVLKQTKADISLSDLYSTVEKSLGR